MGAISLAGAKAHLSELVSKAAGGEKTIITRRGRPVAKLVPIAAPKKPVRSRRFVPPCRSHRNPAPN